MDEYLASSLVKALRTSGGERPSGGGSIYVLSLSSPELVLSCENNPKVRLRPCDLIMSQSLDKSEFRAGDRFYVVKLEECLYLLVCKVGDF